MAKASRYSTPGVYVQEVANPISIAEVETAIPAFIGYTEKAPAKNAPIKISSLLEFEEKFGLPSPESIIMTVVAEGGTINVSVPDIKPKYCLHYQMQMFFGNEGGTCYIVSVGKFSKHKKSKTALLSGLRSIKKKEEITLIVFADSPKKEHHELNKAALAQAGSLGNRFAILDVPDHRVDEIDAFRNNIGTQHLSYGAAYYPKLITNLRPYYTSKSVVLNFLGSEFNGKTFSVIERKEPLLYNQIKLKLDLAIKGQNLVLFPSATVAGVYAANDASRGVWKAPANVGLSMVKAPQIKITDETQEGLNIDPISGISVNAIRTFPGVGVMVWGARTLAGNDNEWRYVSVRRFVINVEESIKKSIAAFVFEPNNANTWTRARASLENYLTGKWREGALAGAKPEDAFYVRVGLGQSMTAQDVLEGRMIIEIGIAVVRPAEFIIIRLTQMMPIT